MNKSNIITIISLIGIVVVGFWGTYPMITQLKDVNLANRAKAQEITLTESKINNLNTLKTDFQRFQTEVSMLSVVAPTTDQLPEILVQIETMAKKSGLEVSSIQPDKASSSSQTDVNLSVKGSFAATLSFLQNLEKNIRPAQVKSLTINSGKLGQSTSLTTNFSLGFLKAQ